MEYIDIYIYIYTYNSTLNSYLSMIKIQIQDYDYIYTYYNIYQFNLPDMSQTYQTQKYWNISTNYPVESIQIAIPTAYM